MNVTPSTILTVTPPRDRMFSLHNGEQSWGDMLEAYVSTTPSWGALVLKATNAALNAMLIVCGIIKRAKSVSSENISVSINGNIVKKTAPATSVFYYKTSRNDERIKKRCSSTMAANASVGMMICGHLLLITLIKWGRCIVAPTGKGTSGTNYTGGWCHTAFHRGLGHCAVIAKPSHTLNLMGVMKMATAVPN